MTDLVKRLSLFVGDRSAAVIAIDCAVRWPNACLGRQLPDLAG